MSFCVGDLLLVAPGSYVPPGGRYSQGIVLSDPEPGFRTVYVAWYDGKITEELVSNLLKSYVRITNDSR
jgi:hypothetical protein